MKQFLKTCSKCRKQKWNSEFNGSKITKDRLTSWCKMCNNKQSEKHSRKHPQRYFDSERATYLQRTFGITEEDYKIMFENQNRVCLICNRPKTTKRNNKLLFLAVDHEHRTNKIRGLLCSNCNRMLGAAKDDPEILRKGANYIEQYT